MKGRRVPDEGRQRDSMNKGTQKEGSMSRDLRIKKGKI